MDIKKDKKGMVYVQGSMVKPARNAKELFALFEEGSTNRHTASTSKSTVNLCHQNRATVFMTTFSFLNQTL